MLSTPKLNDYIQQLHVHDDLLLQEMEELAYKENVPIIEQPSIHFIRSLLQYKGSINRILEIGTAIGYSSIWLAKAVSNAVVDTIERDEQRYSQALHFIEKAGLSQRINVHFGDATTYAEKLQNQTYDVLFIDAAKGQYKTFFEQYIPHLAQDGIVITDNVFFHGEVVNEHIENKRIRSMVKKIKEYNQWLQQHPHFETSFIPVGDGLALSIRRREL